MKAGAYQRQKMPGLVNVDRDDIMAQDLPIGEEVPFVSAYFGDYTDSYSALRANASLVNGQLEPELSRDGSHVVWVENARTGELLPTLLGSLGTSNDDDADGERDNNDPDAEYDESSPLVLPKPLDDSEEDNKFLVTAQAMDNIENGDSSGHSYAAIFLRGLFLLFQGMLAGFNFISVSYLVLDDVSFLSTYQASANEVRRLSFVLSTLAALGSVDNLMSLISRSRRPSLGGAETSNYGTSLITKENGGAFMFAVGACVLYLSSLVLTVLLGGTDTLIYYKFGYHDSSDWVSEALSDHSTEISMWRNLVSIRIAVAAIGWLCSCFLIWKDLVAKDARGHELVRLQSVITSWRRRVDLMEGSSLEGMDGPTLRKLVALQGMGYERTNAALRVVESL